MDGMNPITRKEMFLAAAGGQDVETPTPVTREEAFLDAIVKGGGSSLPSTETASAGDVLSLDDNKEPQWAAPSGGGGVLVVSIGENMVLDKTWQEISDAFGNGIVMLYGDSAIEIVTVVRDASHAETVPNKYNVESFYVWIDGWDSDLGDWKTMPQASVYVCDSANDYPAHYTQN